MTWKRELAADRPLKCARFANAVIGVMLVSGSALGVLCQTRAAGLTSPRLWDPNHPPFSFRYNGEESAQFLPAWEGSGVNVAGGSAQLRLYSYLDPATGLAVAAEVRIYPEFPGVVDWVLRFRNDGAKDTPIIENILPLNFALPASAGDLILHHDRGSQAQAFDFKPIEEPLERGGNLHLESFEGDSSNHDTLPFFNLQIGDHGVIGAIGWTGDWKADFTSAKDGKTIVMTAGMKRTHLVLHPGEEIRTPRIVMMSWTGGDWQDAQNAWRRLLFAQYTPQDKGGAMRGPILFGSWGSEPIGDKLAYIQWVHDQQIPVEVYAVDAGWYGDSFGAETDPTNPWWKNRGDWFPSPRYYPNGIKPLGDALKKAGFGFSLWIESETSTTGKKEFKDHPDWFLRSDRRPDESFVNLGNPAALKGITDMVSGLITDFGMTWYRQDFNIRP